MNPWEAGMWSKVLPLVLALPLAVPGAGAAAAGPGEPDSSFGRNGSAMVQRFYFDNDNRSGDVFVEPDGTILLSGMLRVSGVGEGLVVRSFDPTGGPLARRSGTTAVFRPKDITRAGADHFVVTDGFAVTATTLNGEPDPPIGDAGAVFPELPAGYEIEAVAAQQDRSFVLGASRAEDGDVVVTRLRPDGSPDPTFAGGTVQVDLGGAETVEDVQVQPDGRIVVVGSASGDALVMRFLPDGRRDPGFGVAGVRRVDLGGVDQALLVVVRRNGRLVAGSSSDGHEALFQLTGAGALDPVFGQGGVVHHRALPTPVDMALLPGGGLATAGSSEDSVVSAARSRANGALDRTFSGDGVARLEGYGIERAAGLTYQADGGLLVSLHAPAIGFAVARFRPDGTIDREFGLDGVASLLVNESDETTTESLVDAAGRLVTVGWTWPPLAQAGSDPPEAFVVRHTTDGRIDRSFGDSGFASVGAMMRAVAITFDGSGNLVVAGADGGQSYDQHLAVTRLTSAGAPDPGFTAFVLPAVSAASAVAVRGDGRIVVAGNREDGSSVVVRLLPSGAVDTTFSGDGVAVFPGLVDTAALVLSTGGRIVVAGVRGDDLGVMRLTGRGALDRSFGGDGFVTVDAGATEAAGDLIAAGGGLVVVGSSRNADSSVVLAARLAADGTPDPGFGGDGLVTLPVGDVAEGHAATVQGNGRLLVTGSSDGEVLLARIRANGALDTTFSQDGVVTRGIPRVTGFPAPATGLGLVLDGSGRAVVTATDGHDGCLLAFRLR